MINVMMNRTVLSSCNLIESLGNESDIFRKFINYTINNINQNDNYYLNWKKISIKIYGEQYLSEKIDEKIALFYHLKFRPTIDLLLFVLLTYHSLLIKLFAVEVLFNHLTSSSILKELSKIEDNSILIKKLENIENNSIYSELKIKNFVNEEPFSWYLKEPNDELKSYINRIIKILLKFDFNIIDINQDIFQDFYQNIIHQKIRQRIGEFYTPDWLADFLLQEMNLKRSLDQKILDPSCGSGIFLIKLIKFYKEIGKNKNLNNQVILRNILENINGFELNPTAVLTAKMNYLLNILDLIQNNTIDEINIPIFQKDSLTEKDQSYDILIGNPPWVNWEDLPYEYRNNLIDQCKKYGLFSLKGFQSRLGGGRKDFSMIFLYFCADNYLKINGKLGFLITQTIFKTKGAGEGFRGFYLACENIPLKVEMVHDLVQIKPFNSSNMTALIILEKGKTTLYPINYYKWNFKDQDKIIKNLEEFNLKTVKTSLMANPVDNTNKKSPWLTLPRKLFPLMNQMQPSDYTACLGMNSGGANGVYWVKILSKNGENFEIENLPEEGKKKINKITSLIEEDLLFPVIKSKHLKKWNVLPTNIYSIIVQDINSRKGYQDLENKYPNTYNYLIHFKEILISRAAYKKYFKLTDPFYSMFNINRDLFSPYKVIWNRMGNKLEAAVTSSQFDEYFVQKIVIPDNVLSYIPFTESKEAHYVCALMNSMLISFKVRSFSVSGGKSFGTPSILNHLNIKKYDRSPIHEELSRISELIHGNINNKNFNLSQNEKKIDDLVFELYQIPDDLIDIIIDYMKK
ncbi:MAG: hypothetical protein EAX96_17080 [Candidatus Lokiarchaeota archaeon]|nr:hypothetical protein [Candidatus Lokiarchaeota archaeon]